MYVGSEIFYQSSGQNYLGTYLHTLASNHKYFKRPDTKFELHKKEPTKLELQKNEHTKLVLHKLEPIQK